MCSQYDSNNIKVPLCGHCESVDWGIHKILRITHLRLLAQFAVLTHLPAWLCFATSIYKCTVLIYVPLLFLIQFAAKNLLQGSLCIHQHLCYRPIVHHSHSASCSIQHSVGVCSSGLSDVCHVGSRVPLSVEVSELQ